MFQAFEWYLPYDHQHWNRMKKHAKELRQMGMDMVWLPPAYKAIEEENPVNRAGYGVYDRYDLGEFTQLTDDYAATKYGTREEYEKCIQELQKYSMQVLCDIVVNHMFGREEKEDVEVIQVQENNRFLPAENAEPKTINIPTIFRYPKRNQVYDERGWEAERDGKCSGDTWSKENFNGYVEEYKENGKNKKRFYRYMNREWNAYVDDENENFDCLMGNNLDMENGDTCQKLINWAKWYMNATCADGVRIDAVKHISHEFMPLLLQAMRVRKGENMFAVGEYWSGDVDKLINYLDHTIESMHLFDVSLHYALYHAFSNEESGPEEDLRVLMNNALVVQRPDNAVTFVDNHDTQPGQALKSFIPWDGKQRAYAMILFQQNGIPCVFFGDLYGIPHDNYKPVADLAKMCLVRRSCAHGRQRTYYDHANYIGYTRSGNSDYKYSGMAVLVSRKEGAEKVRMLVNVKHAGKTYVNIFNPAEKVTLNKDGFGFFHVVKDTASVWITQEAFDYLSTKPGWVCTPEDFFK